MDLQSYLPCCFIFLSVDSHYLLGGKVTFQIEEIRSDNLESDEKMMHLKVDSLPDPSNRFDLGEEIATGVWSKVSENSFIVEQKHLE